MRKPESHRPREGLGGPAPAPHHMTEAQRLQHLAMHMLTGVLYFALITMSAYLVHVVRVVAEVNGLEGIVIRGLKLAELAAFTGDIVLFLHFIVRTVCRTIRSDD